ncbi:MAG: hypothetical protein JEZ04_12955 [Spirochaetales bacterium]|nr:hypothetical protein [Spirochaetales bacterium]
MKCKLLNCEKGLFLLVPLFEEEQSRKYYNDDCIHPAYGRQLDKELAIGAF